MAFPDGNEDEHSKRILREEEKEKQNYIGVCLPQTYFTIVFGRTLNSHEDFKKCLQQEVSDLQEVSALDECDVVLVFCTDHTEPARRLLQNVTGSKCVILVVLHHTPDPENLEAEYRYMNKKDANTVHCLFHEDKGLLQFPKNKDAIKKVKDMINTKRIEPAHTTRMDSSKRLLKVFISGKKPKKYFTVVIGNTCNSDQDIKKLLHKQGLVEVCKAEECDFILVFCPIVSRAGTDIEDGLQKLNNISESKPAILVVLHHTFDPKKMVPDSYRHVTRKNTFTVDCLFYEDKGLLHCLKNDDALKDIKNWISCELSQSQVNLKTSESKQMPQIDEMMKARLTYEETVKDYDRKLKQHKNMIEQEEINIKTSALTTGFEEFVLATELTLVLLGRTGSGKSATGNTILGREERNQAGTSTETLQSEIRQGDVDGMQVTVVDTPDWFCPELSLEEVRQDMELCVRLSAPGPLAFLLVIPVKQPAGEEKGILEKMEEIFGERCWRNTMILFTVADEQRKKDVEKFAQSGNQEVCKLVKKCGDRFHCLNIKENVDGSQVLDLMEKIEGMMEGNRLRNKVSDIIRNTEKKRKETEAGIRQVSQKMQEALKKSDMFINNLEEDMLKAVNVDVKEIVKMLKNTWEIKKTLWQQITTMYKRVAWMEVDRHFIKIMLPGTQHAVWLSVLDRQDECVYVHKDKQLTKLNEFFWNVLPELRHKDFMKYSDTLGR